MIRQTERQAYYRRVSDRKTERKRTGRKDKNKGIQEKKEK